MKYLLVGALLMCATYTTTLAQNTRQYTTNHNAWLMYFGSHKLSPKWGLHLEAQLRRSEWGEGPQQLLLRPGINYHFNPQAFATVGYCFVETYPYGEFGAPVTFPEHRFWEQIQVRTQIGRVELINRYRLEQRYVYAPVLGNNGFEPGDAIYTNRFRWLGRISVPFKGKTIIDKSFYVTVYDEIMASFGENISFNIFDQNRAYLALGYRIPKIGRLEVGYLNQLLFRGDGRRVENNHTLQLGLFANMDFYKHNN
jgi:hypothetical protein